MWIPCGAHPQSSGWGLKGLNIHSNKCLAAFTPRPSSFIYKSGKSYGSSASQLTNKPLNPTWLAWRRFGWKFGWCSSHQNNYNNWHMDASQIYIQICCYHGCSIATHPKFIQMMNSQVQSAPKKVMPRFKAKKGAHVSSSPAKNRSGQANRFNYVQLTRAQNAPDGSLSYVEDDIKHTSSGWWLYTHPSEKYEFVNWDDELFPICGNIELMFQTTNRSYIDWTKRQLTMDHR